MEQASKQASKTKVWRRERVGFGLWGGREVEDVRLVNEEEGRGGEEEGRRRRGWGRDVDENREGKGGGGRGGREGGRKRWM